MSQWQCPECPESLPSLEAFKEHALKLHNSYFNKPKPEEPIELKDLTIDTLESYKTVKGQVKYILEQYPQARSDDKILILKHMQLFQKALAYDPNTKLISFRNKEGISYELFRLLVSFETITRCRRLLQEKYAELRASERVALKRERREKIIHDNIRYM